MLVAVGVFPALPDYSPGDPRLGVAWSLMAVAFWIVAYGIERLSGVTSVADDEQSFGSSVESDLRAAAHSLVGRAGNHRDLSKSVWMEVVSGNRVVDAAACGLCRGHVVAATEHALVECIASLFAWPDACLSGLPGDHRLLSDCCFDSIMDWRRSVPAQR